MKLISSAICMGIVCGLGCGRSEMTKAQVSEMFDKAGGADKINQEAKIIFNHYGTNISTVIYGQQLTNFPAISSLSSSVFLQTNSGWSTCIEIPIGSHYQKSFIFIFDPDDAIEFPYASSCIAVTTNIFVGK
ncbi:MAG: hypothetical protein ABSG87_01425 [Verrucomicrobiota bacterium]